MSNLRTCVACGKTLAPYHVSCPYCGDGRANSKFASEQNCHSCKGKIEATERYCRFCGANSEYFEKARNELISTNVAAKNSIKCPNCEAPNSSSGKYCHSCGAELNIKSESIQKHFCTECGTENSDNQIKCQSCGVDLTAQIEFKKSLMEKQKRKDNVKKGLAMGAAFLYALGQNSGQGKPRDEVKMADLVFRTCPFCGSQTMGTGPCNRCAR